MNKVLYKQKCNCNLSTALVIIFHQPSETHLPSSASIQLPQVHVEAELIQDDTGHSDQHAGKDIPYVYFGKEYWNLIRM